MARSCEVCAHLENRPAVARATRSRLRRVAIDGRIVALCEAHAAAVVDSQAQSLDVLRELFRERGGNRSLVDRRSPLDRRLFPPRPEGRRLSTGRRSNDQGA